MIQVLAQKTYFEGTTKKVKVSSLFIKGDNQEVYGYHVTLSAYHHPALQSLYLSISCTAHEWQQLFDKLNEQACESWVTQCYAMLGS